MTLIFRYIKRHIGVFFVSIFFLCLEAAADLLQPAYMARIVDIGVRNADTARILHYGLIMMAIAGVGAFGAVMRNIFSSYMSQTVGKELSRDMYKKVLSLSFENIDRLRPPAIITRITNDVVQIQAFVNSSMRIMLKAPITCVGAIVLIIMQTPQEAPVIIGILVIAAALIFTNMRFGYPRFQKRQEKLDSLNGVSREFLSSIRVIKSFHAEDREKAEFKEASRELSAAGVSAIQAVAVFSPLINLTVNLGIVILLWKSQNQSSADIGRLMASVNYMTQVLFALSLFSGILYIAVRAVASSERINEIFEEEPVQKMPACQLCPEIKGEIEFDDVSFTYAKAERESLSHVSFCAHQGETIGIIGATGAGKSTLVSLIPRFYDAESGSIRIDGMDVTHIGMEALRSGIALVSQRALLFSGTIMENLRWGSETVTEEEVKAAAAYACSDAFIESFKDGYDTLLGQGGVNLSGGQKQRISLMRALLRKPRILILDDCTSALDAETEARVLGGLRDFSGQTTMLLISQRIAAVMRSDKILCLEDGSVCGFGTHEVLMKSCPTYQAIYRSQIGGGQNG